MRNRTSFAGSVTLAVVAAAMLVGCGGPVDLGPVADAASAKSIREAFAFRQGGQW